MFLRDIKLEFYILPPVCNPFPGRGRLTHGKCHVLCMKAFQGRASNFVGGSFAVWFKDVRIDQVCCDCIQIKFISVTLCNVPKNVFGFLDNGEGMNVDILGRCLGIGATTRQARKGMGRFGVGLPQASLHACPKVEVYFWQNGIGNCHKVFLDINKVKDGTQTEIEDPELINVPEKYAPYISYRTLTDSYDLITQLQIMLDNLKTKD